MKKSFLTLCAIMAVIAVNGKTPEGYYAGVSGKTGDNILEALYQKISSHTNVGYDGLYEAYEKTDVTADGYVWDMYSTCVFNHAKSEQCGNYSAVCDCYNREHSVPQSWWSNGSMKSDIFHVYPTDGKVNGQRGNFPFGECANGTTLPGGHAKGKLGNSTFSGYTGKVFEPADEYKGDFARSYFYMVACYRTSSMAGSEGKNVFTYSNGKSNLTTYAINLFMKWHREDPVSEKELKRNDAAYSVQKNRNPFIDYPELAEYIWGNKKGETVEMSKLTNAYDGGSYSYPTLTSPAADEKIAFGTVEVGEKATYTFTLKGVELEQSVTLTIGGDNPAFFTVSPSTVRASQALAGHTIAVIYEPTQTGQHTATLTISSTEFASITLDITARAKLTGSGEIEVPAGDYVKVTENLTNWEGIYLIVHESEDVYLDGSNPANFSKTNNASVTIIDNKIAATDDINDAAFTIEVADGGYTIKSKDGYYIGHTGSKNTLDSSTETEFVNTIKYTGGSTYIETDGRVLQYNKSSHQFRYYTSGQDVIQLYKKIADTPTSIAQHEATTARLTAINGGLLIAAETAIPVQVYDYLGRQIFANDAATDVQISLPQGMYIVRLGDSVQKVIVR